MSTTTTAAQADNHTTTTTTTTTTGASSSSSSGISSYNPISNLSKQYAAPVGSRLFLFVKTNPNCCLIGGVEALLKQKNYQDQPLLLVNTNTNEASAGGGMSEDSSGGGNSGGGGMDPFGFLSTTTTTTTPSPTTPSPPTTTTTTKKKLQVGKFFTKLAKQTTEKLEKGITNLAIKADQGKNPDYLMIGLYDSSGLQLWSLTETQKLPITDYERMKGVTFCIPLTVPPPSAQEQTTVVVTLKLWIKSGAALLKQKYYLLGQAHVSLQKLQADPRVMSPLMLGLQSQSIVDGQLQLMVCKDLKFPQLHGRGWSLTDADMSGYGAAAAADQGNSNNNALFRLPLDQSYGFSRRGDWWIATERSTESSVVLPVATAMAQMAAQACQISLSHATSVAQTLLQHRHDDFAPGKNDAKAELKVGYLLNTKSGSAAALSLSWQRPDSIFEVELLPPTKIPVHMLQIPFTTSTTTTFYPNLVTTDILPALLQQHATQPAYLLGNVRLLVTLTTMTSAGDPFGPSGPGTISANLIQEEQWQATFSLESYVNRPTTEPLQVPLTRKGVVMGSLVLQLSVTLPTEQAAPPRSVTPCTGGLVSLMGLDTLMEGTLPLFDTNGATPPADPQVQRRHQQLKTMGSFMSHQYVQNHITSTRSQDLTILTERAHNYSQALQFNPQTELLPPHKDRSPKPFRPSSSRNTVELAGIPFNVHTVTLALEQGPTTDGTPGGFFQNISCGAPADHARGFAPIFPGGPSGGLRRLEAMRLEYQQKLQEAQTALIQVVATFFVAARQETQAVFFIPARNQVVSNLRWKVFELTQQLHQITWTCAVRRAVVLSQSVGIALTSYLTSISSSPERADMWVKHGYLITYEGLLSAAGKELGMIEDASVGIAMLKAVSVVLVPTDAASPQKVNVVNSPHLKWVSMEASGVGSATQYLLKVGVDTQYYNTRLPVSLRNNAPVRFFPLLYQVGVDIHQAAAHTHANYKAQVSTAINTSNALKSELDVAVDDDDEDGPSDTDVLVALNYEAFRKMNFYAHAAVPTATPDQQQQVHPILLSLHAHIVGSSGKMNHGILDEAASVAQKLGGGAAVFCKSGKDRTAMHITYKQAQYIHRYLGDNVQNSVILEDTNRFRVYGTRLPICEKNVGVAKYAFNTLQVRFMPELLKPPTITLAGFLKGGAVFQKGGGIES